MRHSAAWLSLYNTRVYQEPQSKRWLICKRTNLSKLHTEQIYMAPCLGLEKQLQCFCKNGQLEQAFHVLSLMDQQGIIPSEDGYLSVLKICCKSRKLNYAKLAYAHLAQNGCDISGVLGDQLVVSMYKCGSIVDCNQVFCILSSHSVLSYTALMCCYVDHGNPCQALRLYKYMMKDGVKPNHYTFVILLKACSSVPDIEQGKKLHSIIKRKGLTSNIYIMNTLVSMYGKCGNISEAEDVFMDITQHDIVSWNALLTAYIEQNEFEKALWLYRQMKDESITADETTFVITLQAIGSLSVLGAVESVSSTLIADGFHADARKKRFSSQDFLSSTLISTYGKCCALEKAENTFTSLGNLDIARWNAMLSAYADTGLGGKVLQGYIQLRKEGIYPDPRTFVITLQACCLLSEKENVYINNYIALEIGEALLDDASKLGFDSNIFIKNALISLYGKCRNIQKAENIFERAVDRRDVTWNAMLTAYIEQGKGRKALQLFSTMCKEGVIPSNVTYVLTLQACSELTDQLNDTTFMGSTLKSISLEICQALHADLDNAGLISDAMVTNTLMHIYGKCGDTSKAETLFAGLSHQNTVSYNALLSSYLQQGKDDKVLCLFLEMEKNKVSFDEVTVSSALQAAGMASSTEICMKVHFAVTSTGCDITPLISTTVVHAYGNCALSTDAEAVFLSLPQVDFISWSAYVDAFIKEGNCMLSLKAFDEMRMSGFCADEVTFFSILSACSHDGFVDIGINLFESMLQDTDQILLKHYSIMIDLLGRAGNFDRIERMITFLPIKTDLGFWFSLLVVCRNHNNLTMAEYAFNRIMQLEPNKTTAYILMSNMYALEMEMV